jgi:hypothetical protein
MCACAESLVATLGNITARPVMITIEGKLGIFDIRHFIVKGAGAEICRHIIHPSIHSMRAYHTIQIPDSDADRKRTVLITDNVPRPSPFGGTKASPLRACDSGRDDPAHSMQFVPQTYQSRHHDVRELEDQGHENEGRDQA